MKRPTWPHWRPSVAPSSMKRPTFHHCYSKCPLLDAQESPQKGSTEKDPAERWPPHSLRLSAVQVFNPPTEANGSPSPWDTRTRLTKTENWKPRHLHAQAVSRNGKACSDPPRGNRPAPHTLGARAFTESKTRAKRADQAHHSPPRDLLPHQHPDQSLGTQSPCHDRGISTHHWSTGGCIFTPNCLGDPVQIAQAAEVETGLTHQRKSLNPPETTRTPPRRPAPDNAIPRSSIKKLTP